MYPIVGTPVYNGVPNQLTVEINHNATTVDFLNQAFLFAPRNSRYFFQDPLANNTFVDVGRSLQSYVDIAPGTPITSANGIFIDTSEAARIQNDDPVHAAYLIQLDDDVILDTYHNCKYNQPPLCLFSMANNAIGLIDNHSKLPFFLTPDHNNARCTVIHIDNNLQCVLYAIQHIPSHTDIMWSYDRSPIQSPQKFPSNGLRNAYNTVLDLESRLLNISVSDESAQLTALGSYHESNAPDA